MFSAEKLSIVFRHDFYRNRGALNVDHNNATPAGIVLDTNVALDWLLFADPDGRRVGEAIRAGEWRWIATLAMRNEHFDVLERPTLQRWAPDAAAQRAVWNAHCRLVDAPMPPCGAIPLRCADPDDQMFVDLAVVERPAWLLSRDKALLALAPQLRQYGVRVATPSAWGQKKAAAAATAF